MVVFRVKYLWVAIQIFWGQNEPLYPSPGKNFLEGEANDFPLGDIPSQLPLARALALT